MSTTKTKRGEFTEKVIRFLQKMIDSGEEPIIDYVKRGLAEQQEMYKTGKSKADGINKVSKHQSALAIDIYFIGENNELDFSYTKYEKWHNIWQNEFGGRPIIDWDINHFE